MARRTIKGLIQDWQRARRRQIPEEETLTALNLGAALARTGPVIDAPATGNYATIWQPLPTTGPDGQPAAPGFAPAQFPKAGRTFVPKELELQPT